MASSCTLTVFFEDPFWVGIAEITDEDGYQAARHVFGAEPTDPEVMGFVLQGWKRLAFTSKTELEPPKEKHLNPKRRLRQAKKEMAASTMRGTKAQLALTASYEASKVERKRASKQRREQEQQEAFERRREKRKQKHRGH